MDCAARRRTLHRDPLTRLVSRTLAVASFCAVTVMLALAAPAVAAPGWSAPTPIDIGFTAPDDIACPSSSFCMAVNFFGNATSYIGQAWGNPVNVDGGHPLT